MTGNGVWARAQDIQKQADALEDWIRENAPEVTLDQKHLDAGTPERAYWHHGRLVALRDFLRLMAN